MRLEELVGQEQAVRGLVRAVAGGRVPHGYLFDGPAGTGKRSAAIGLALALDCTSPPAPGGSCGACEACRRILAGLHPDVVSFAPDGAQIVMEQAQEIVALGQRRPHEAPARVVIVDDADRLNASASNCLLKTLEEPARGNHLVLVTTAPERLLGTIRSRTQRVRFQRAPVPALLELAARRGIEPARARVAAVLADGSVRRLLDLVESGSAEQGAGAATALRRAARAPAIAPLLDAAAELGDKEGKQSLPDVLALLGRVYRDALVTVAGAPELAVLQPGHGDSGGGGAAAELDLPQGLDLRRLGRALDAIVEADTALAANTNAPLVLERMLLALRRAEEKHAPAPGRARRP